MFWTIRDKYYVLISLFFFVYFLFYMFVDFR